MTAQSDLMLDPRRVYSTSINSFSSAGVFETSDFNPQPAGELTTTWFPTKETAYRNPLDDQIIWNELEELCKRRYLVAFWGQRDLAPFPIDPTVMSADLLTLLIGTPKGQNIEAISEYSSYFNFMATTLLSKENEVSLRNIVQLPEPETLAPKPGSTGSASDYARLHITGPLFEEFNTCLERSRTDLFNSRLVEVLDRTEVKSCLHTLEENGQAHLGLRIRALQESDEEDEDDLPLNDQAVLAFLDFIDNVSADEIDLGLTTAQGWLCAQWTYSDGRVLVVWFKNRIDSMLTAFGSQGKILGHIGRDSRAGNPESASQLLVQEGFFSWRLKQSV